MTQLVLENATGPALPRSLPFLKPSASPLQSLPLTASFPARSLSAWALGSLWGQTWAGISEGFVPAAVTLPLGDAAHTSQLVVTKVSQELGHTHCPSLGDWWHCRVCPSSAALTFRAACRCDSSVPVRKPCRKRKCQLDRVFSLLFPLLLLQ